MEVFARRARCFRAGRNSVERDRRPVGGPRGIADPAERQGHRFERRAPEPEQPLVEAAPVVDYAALRVGREREVARADRNRVPTQVTDLPRSRIVGSDELRAVRDLLAPALLQVGQPAAGERDGGRLRGEAATRLGRKA